MSQVTRTFRSWFPAVMIVVCSAVYFVFFDPRDPQGLEQAADSVPAIGSEQGSIPKKAGILGTTKYIPSVETRERTQPNTGVIRISSVEEKDDTRLEVVALETEDSSHMQGEPLRFASEQQALQSITRAEGSITTDLSQSEVLPAVDNLVINNRYQKTPVQDYWVGLERAGTDETVVSNTEELSNDTEELSKGVVYNPFFSPSPGSANPPTNPDASRQVFEPKLDLDLAEFVPSIPLETLPFHLDRNALASEERLPSSGSIIQTSSSANSARHLTSVLEDPSDSPSIAQPKPHSTIQPAPLPATMSDSARAMPFPINEHVRQRVLEHWEYGSSLARRDAIHLAQREFFSGMSLLADHFDQLQGSTHYLVALREGFSALHEAGDFQSSRQSRPADVLVIAQRHETPVLRERHFETTSHSQARTAYLLYAKERLKFVFKNQIAADELFYALGKLHLATFEQSRKTDNIEFQRAATLFECALMANPRHAKSNNELAVILAKNGQWASAKQLLQQTVAQHAEFTEAWENLVKVHQRLGELELASLAAQQVERLRRESDANPSVKLINKVEFAQTEAAMEGNDNFAVPAGGDQRPQSVSNGRIETAASQAPAPSRFGQGPTSLR